MYMYVLDSIPVYYLCRHLCAHAYTPVHVVKYVLW